mgnify:CR=1 FL=1
MSDDYGSDFITVTDEDGNDFELEHLGTLEYKGSTYMAFVPADMDEEDEEEDEGIGAHGPNPYVTYSRNDLENLDPAYAITIHKSQGSEFPAVIMPFLNSHFVMLERNLLYTGVTRAKKYLFLKGQRNAIYKAVKTISMLLRNSNLRSKLQGDFGQISFFGENMGLY